MNLSSARLYAYVFFEVPYELRKDNMENDEVLSFFRQWKDEYQLKQAKTFDMGDPDLTMLRLAENEALSACVFRFHDIDVFEIQWDQTEPDASPFDFWNQCTDDLEKQLADVSYFGAARAYFANSDDISTSTLKTIVKRCNWKFSPKWPLSEIPYIGNLYSVGKHSYILLSDNKELSTFLGRDFPIMESVIQKVEFENTELNKIKAQNDKSESQVQKLVLTEKPGEIEKNLTAVKEYQAYIHRNTSLLARLQQTLDINILNLENFLISYPPEKDTLFSAVLMRVKKIRRQSEFDLNYAHTILQGIESHLRLLELTIENRREKGQQRIERWIAVLGIAIGMGQIAANIPVQNKDLVWVIQLGLMGIIVPVTFILLWILRKGK